MPSPKPKLQIQVTQELVPAKIAKQLSPAQIRFNQLLAQIEQSRIELQNVKARADFVRDQLSGTVNVLIRQSHEETVALLLAIDQLLITHAQIGKRVGADITERRLRIISDFFTHEAEKFLHGQPDQPGYAEIVSAFERVSGMSWELFKRERLEQLVAMYAREVGHRPAALDEVESVEDLVEIMREEADAARQQMEEEENAIFEEYESIFEARKNKAQVERAKARAEKKAKKQEEAEHRAKTEVKQSLRELMRKLVSALHPDREPDAKERERKTEIMKRVNEAYERNDLLTLLSLQLEIEPVGVGCFAKAKQNQVDDIAKFSDERVKQYIRVLEDQLRSLRDEQAGIRQSILHWLQPSTEFLHQPGSPSCNASLDKLLKLQIERAKVQLERAQSDRRDFTLPGARGRLIDHWDRMLRYR
jgi:hypothetical protein